MSAEVVEQAREVRHYAAAAGLPALGDDLVLAGVSVEEARDRVDAARWAELRAAFGAWTGGE